MKSLKNYLFIFILLFTFSPLFGNVWEFQFKIYSLANQDTTIYESMPITIYRFDANSRNYISLGSGWSSATQNWDGYNALVNIVDVPPNHSDAIMTIDFTRFTWLGLEIALRR
jgi:hypothetical protein